MSLGLYVHIPFCSAICNYCNFNRGLFDAPLKERYVAALLADEPRREAMGAAARSLARERYGWPDIAARLEAVYVRAVGAPGVRAAA